MANHKSAEKRFRRDEKRRELNHQRSARIRTFIKKVEKAMKPCIFISSFHSFVHCIRVLVDAINFA